jgi:hypothetical protein
MTPVSLVFVGILALADSQSWKHLRLSFSHSYPRLNVPFCLGMAGVVNILPLVYVIGLIADGTWSVRISVIIFMLLS